MALEVAIQMDPIETVSINGDSSFALALEAQKRGHRLYHYLPRHLTFRDRRVTARVAPLEVRRVADQREGGEGVRGAVAPSGERDLGADARRVAEREREGRGHRDSVPNGRSCPG